MYYKITVVRLENPSAPEARTGKVTEREGEHPLLTALAKEYGEGESTDARERLYASIGLDSAHWFGEVVPSDPTVNHKFCATHATYRVRLSDTPFPR